MNVCGFGEKAGIGGIARAGLPKKLQCPVVLQKIGMRETQGEISLGRRVGFDLGGQVLDGFERFRRGRRFPRQLYIAGILGGDRLHVGQDAGPKGQNKCPARNFV